MIQRQKWVKSFFIFLLLAWVQLFGKSSVVTPIDKEPINLGMVISGGVSLGAYESGYNWAMIRMLSAIRAKGITVQPTLRSVAGASAGSINALLNALYWCQDPNNPENNSVEQNLFYNTWVDLDIKDLLVPPDDTKNHSALFSRRVLNKKADAIMRHLYRPVFREGCEVALGFSVTKVMPIVEEFEGIPIENQAFAIPLTMKVKKRKIRFESRRIGNQEELHVLEIPSVERDPKTIKKVLFASSAFPGAFTQVKLRYRYKGKPGEGYFIDGGVYNNTPLDLAIALDNRTSLFLFLDPAHLRKHKKKNTVQKREKPPVGFLSANLAPLANAANIYQKMFLYQAINRYFRGHPERRLILSSRFHPLTAGFLEHFGAFLDRNFRLYDYHVGVYDAIYQLAEALRHKAHFSGFGQLEMMDRLARKLGLDKSPEARTAYRFFKATEFHKTKPKRNNRYAAIYYAFKKGVDEETRYSAANFKYFLRHLDTRYLTIRPHSFLAYATRHPDGWYKRPLRYIINRITALENYHAEVDPSFKPIAEVLNVLAWSGSTFVRNKSGWDVQSIHAPRDKRHLKMRDALRLLPKGIAVDSVNGGASFAYEASYYADIGWIDGVQFRGSYNFQSKHDGGDFVRLDADLMHAYNEALTFGFGLSGFGNIERSFWDRQSAYGLNAYVDFMEILRATYVWRHGERVNNQALYLGIENLPSLIYWLER